LTVCPEGSLGAGSLATEAAAGATATGAVAIGAAGANLLMKILNQIEADKTGVIKQILIEDAQSVEYDQALFIIE
jgi:hypothetical protein